MTAEVLKMSDYQQFDLQRGEITNVGDRMQKKLKAIPLPELTGKTVLDIGCDFGFWTWISVRHGASKVVGLDRNRVVRDMGFVDLIDANKRVAVSQGWDGKTDFQHIEIGSQYRDVGKFDVAYCFSMYHHAYQCAGGDHLPLWFWFRRQLKPGGILLWENPVSEKDAVVQANVSQVYWEDYNIDSILYAASQYFTYERIGPALHEPYREVYRLVANPGYKANLRGFVERGGSGAHKAFEYAEGRRMKEIERVLGYKPYTGSLNVRTLLSFPWEENYFRAEILDVADREKGLDGDWISRWMRFYPLKANGTPACAIRFEEEEYSPHFVELVSKDRLDVPNVYAYKTLGTSDFINKETGQRAIEINLELEK